jgi:hypothetical protein
MVLAGIRRFDTPSSFPHGVIVAEDVARAEILRARATSRTARREV